MNESARVTGLKELSQPASRCSEVADKVDRFFVLGVPISVTGVDAATKLILSWADDDVGRFVCVRDMHGVMRAHDDPAMLEAHHRAALVTPDGMPLVALGRLQGRKLSRTTGTDLMEAVVDKGRAVGLRHFLYGGKPGVAELLSRKFAERFPGVHLVGCESPPFHEPTTVEAEATRQAILDSGANIVWVGLSTPKQETWMVANFEKVGATLLGVGAAFDFHAGIVRRAPIWMQKSGLEWLHRLASEPRRLWRRYLVLGPRFLFLASREVWIGKFRR